MDLGPPVVPCLTPFFGWEGFPTEIDKQTKKLVPPYSILSSGEPRDLKLANNKLETFGHSGSELPSAAGGPTLHLPRPSFLWKPNGTPTNPNLPSSPSGIKGNLDTTGNMPFFSRGAMLISKGAMV